MNSKIGKFVFEHKTLYPIVATALTLILSGIFCLLGNNFMALKILFWGFVISSIGFCLPGSIFNRSTMEEYSNRKKIFTAVVAVTLIFICIFPMGLNPIWNGSTPGWRNQYELLAESFLKGHTYIDYNGDDAALSQLSNPYDPALRKEFGVKLHWDHAYYNGHYYVYFGVVPVILTFLPYRIITGQTLTTYHATQIFVAGIILGFFALFHLLSKLFFKKITYGMYLFITIAFSVMSIWYSINSPALYCTAITAAIFLEIWSLFFFIKAVWLEKSENKQIIYAFVGALLGALCFGCRPTIALANILVIPMLIVFLSQRKCSPKLIGKLVLAATPYVVVAAALMWYNYIRFQNPFEFGQTYQLTVSDQTAYSSVLDSLTNYRDARNLIIRQIRNMIYCLIYFPRYSSDFPYITMGSLIANFPMLFLSFGALATCVRRQMKQKKLCLFALGIFLTSMIITFMDILLSPVWLERYHMDIYFLLSILCFIVIGLTYNGISEKHQKKYACFVMVFSLITFLIALALFLIPYDSNFTTASPWILSYAEKIVFFWK